MFDFFSQVIGFIEVAWQYFMNLISSLIMAVGFLATSISFPLAIVSYMPAIIGTAIVVFMAIFVIRFLIGRS